MTTREGSFGQASTGDFDRVLVVDLGAQYAQLIARRVREAHVLSEIVPRDITAAEVMALSPSGLILSGGPASVYADDAYQIDSDIFDLDVPILGICSPTGLEAGLPGREVPNTARRSSPSRTAPACLPNSPKPRTCG